MKFFLILSKRTLAVIMAAVIIIFVLVAWAVSAKAAKIDGSTNEARMVYLKSLKLAAEDKNLTAKDIFIPQDFSPVYENYNELQKKSGFDLSDYKGKPATVYTYGLSGTDKQIHLIVCDGKIIGGDIADVKLGGKMQPLK